MANHTEETRVVYIASGVASAAATGYGEVDYPTNAWAILNCVSAGGGTVTVAISTGTATGAAGSALTTITANANTTSVAVHLNDKVSKYVYASGSGSAGAPVWQLSVVGQGYANSAAIMTAGTPSEG